MQILTVTTADGRELKVPAQLPEPIAELAISCNVPMLHRRNVRVMCIMLGLVCCDCAEHLIGVASMTTMN
jgi:hypothetical protein